MRLERAFFEARICRLKTASWIKLLDFNALKLPYPPAGREEKPFLPGLHAVALSKTLFVGGSARK
jgi:hypothetical protein